MYSGKVVVFEQKLLIFGQSCCIQAKVLYSHKSGFIWEKLWYLDKSCCVRAQTAVFEQIWLYSGKDVVFGQNYLISGKSG